ncbi:hypothetical protein PENTCL1PPCAC_20153, partial [Pristionchus entomophagus]
FLLLLVLFSWIPACKPLELSVEQQARFRRIFGDDVNITAVLAILADEAAMVGETAEKRLSNCFSNSDDDELVTPLHVTDAMEEIKAKSENVHFNSTKEVLEVIKKELPKTYVVFLKLFKNDLNSYDQLIAQLDDDSARFLRNLKTTVLETVVNWSGMKDYPKYIPLLGRAITKVLNGINSLSTRSMVNFEKAVCVRSLYRILNLEGRASLIRLRITLLVAQGGRMEPINIE